jgi:hypothetical protein
MQVAEREFKLKTGPVTAGPNYPDIVGNLSDAADGTLFSLFFICTILQQSCGR